MLHEPLDDDSGELASPALSAIDRQIDRVYRLSRIVGLIAVFVVGGMAALGFAFTSPTKRIADQSTRIREINEHVASAIEAQRVVDSIQTVTIRRIDSVQTAKLDKLTRLVYMSIYDQCQRAVHPSEMDRERCQDIYRTMRPDP